MVDALSDARIPAFQRTVWDHYHAQKRDMPWRRTSDPYHIFVSEVMLQQTQVDRVRDKYAQFIGRFPGFAALARASLADVLAVWQGLGYNRRALHLKKAAEMVVKRYDGHLPSDPAVLATMPGIGYATAASIAVFAFNAPVVFIETNIRTVFIHHFFEGQVDIHDDVIRPLVAASLDRARPREWYWALMDYGSFLKKSVPNPSRRSTHHARQSKFEGSDRQLRGAILRALVAGVHTEAQLAAATDHDPRLRRVLADMVKEGLVVAKGKRIVIAHS